MLSDKVIAEIDSRFGEEGRSRFLEDAAREKLEPREFDEAVLSTSGILEDTEYPKFKDQDSINRWVRAQRQTAEAS